MKALEDSKAYWMKRALRAEAEAQAARESFVAACKERDLLRALVEAAAEVPRPLPQPGPLGLEGRYGA